MRKNIFVSVFAAIIIIMGLCSCGNNAAIFGKSKINGTAEKYCSAYFNFKYDEAEKYGVIGIKEFYEKYYKHIAESQEKSIDEYLNELSSEFIEYELTDKPFESLDDYINWNFEENKEASEKEIGKYTVEVSASGNEKVSDSDREKMLDELTSGFDEGGLDISDFIDLSKIQDVYKVRLTAVMKTDKGENNTDRVLVYVTEYGGKWKVINVGANFGIERE